MRKEENQNETCRMVAAMESKHQESATLHAERDVMAQEAESAIVLVFHVTCFDAKKIQRRQPQIRKNGLHNHTIISSLGGETEVRMRLSKLLLALAVQASVAQDSTLDISLSCVPEGEFDSNADYFASVKFQPTDYSIVLDDSLEVDSFAGNMVETDMTTDLFSVSYHNSYK